MNTDKHVAPESAASGEPVAVIRTWHKGGEQHAELWDWRHGLDALPDGEHNVYAAPQPAPAPASGWQPIETAPKDGTAVILCWAINADGEPINWSKQPKTAGVFVQVASWWDGDNAWIVYCSMPREPELHFNPTHWMPLPEPPQ